MREAARGVRLLTLAALGCSLCYSSAGHAADAQVPGAAQAASGHAIAEKFSTEADRPAMEAAQLAVERKKKEADAKAEEAEMLATAMAEAEARRAVIEKAREAALRAEREAEQRQVANRLAAATARAAEQKRIAEENRAAEARRVAEQKAADEARKAQMEAQHRADEARRIAEAKRAEDARKLADAARIAEAKRLEEARQQAQAQEQAQQQAKARAMAAEREVEAQRVTERLRQAREAHERRAQLKAANPPQNAPETARQAPPFQNPNEAFAGLGGPGPDRSGAGFHSGVNAPAVAGQPAGATRVTVLLLMEPGHRGIRRHNRTADPLLCNGGGCFVSNGAQAAASFLPGRRALGFGRTFGARAGACSNTLGCVFRDVELGVLPVAVQPVDMRILHHDRREPQTIQAPADCRALAGRLACRRTIQAGDYTMWVIREDVASAAGPAALERALAEGLPDSEHAAAFPETWRR